MVSVTTHIKYAHPCFSLSSLSFASRVPLYLGHSPRGFMRSYHNIPACNSLWARTYRGGAASRGARFVTGTRTWKGAPGATLAGTVVAKQFPWGSVM